MIIKAYDILKASACLENRLNRIDACGFPSLTLIRNLHSNTSYNAVLG